MTSAPTTSGLDRLRPLWRDRAVVANLVAQIVIVVTGGAVRLTGSGLGCSSWPACEPGRFTPELHPETSYHAFVEFGNRTLTGVLVVIALAVAVLAGLDATRSRAYRVLAWVPLVGVGVQAVVGGMAVRWELPPAVVGSHMALSLVLIAASAWLLVRTREGDGPAVPVVDRLTRGLVGVLLVVTAVLLGLGIVTTGAGPHSGDDEVGYRFAVDPLDMSRLHAAAVWVFVALLAFTLYRLQRLARRQKAAAAGTPPELSYARADGSSQPVRGVAPHHQPPPPSLDAPLRSGYWVLGAALVQGAIGYVQVLTNLPIALVNLHMLGAAVVVAALTFFVGTLRRREGAPSRAVAEAANDVADAAAA